MRRVCTVERWWWGGGCTGGSGEAIVFSRLRNGSLSSASTASENVGPWEHARGGGGLRMQDVMEWDMVEVIAQAGRGV